MAKFDKEKDELLVESVQCYNALFNKSDKEHKNTIYKHKCWEQVSEVVGFPECKKRWKSLRDQYNKKIKEGNNTWEYMNLMSFLTDGSERQRNIPTGITLNDSQTSVSNTEVNTGIDSECDNTQTIVPKAEVNTGLDFEWEVNLENRHTHGHFDTDAPPPGPSTSKKRKLSKLQGILDKRASQRLNLLESLVSNIQRQSQVQPQSAIKKFFESMAEVVENFPAREQAIIRAKVCQLISDTEIKLSSQDPLGPN